MGRWRSPCHCLFTTGKIPLTRRWKLVQACVFSVCNPTLLLARSLHKSNKKTVVPKMYKFGPTREFHSHPIHCFLRLWRMTFRLFSTIKCCASQLQVCCRHCVQSQILANALSVCLYLVFTGDAYTSLPQDGQLDLRSVMHKSAIIKFREAITYHP